MHAAGDGDRDAPIGAPVLPPVDVVKRLSVPSYTDAADIVLRCAEAQERVELLWIERRSRWLGLRHEVRFELRGTAWDVERLWDEICDALPSDGGAAGGSGMPWWP